MEATLDKTLNKFEELFYSGKESIKLSYRCNTAAQALLDSKEVSFVSNDRISGAQFSLDLFQNPYIEINPHLNAVDLLGALVHEVRHYKNRKGLNLYRLFRDMDYPEFYRWNLKDELEAHRDQIFVIEELLKIVGQEYSLSFQGILEAKDRLRDYIVLTKFASGHHYPSAWLTMYENRLNLPDREVR